ncbi:hypothetical protein MDAP_002314 [Mitosporidium daphniae]
MSARGDRSSRGGRGGKNFQSKAALPPSIQHSISGYPSSYAINALMGEVLAPKKSSKPLFPEFSLPIPEPIVPRIKRLLSIKQQLDAIFANSAYHIEEKQPPKKVPRYSDKYEKPASSKPKIHDIHIANLKAIPEELLAVYRPEKAFQKKIMSSLSLSFAEDIQTTVSPIQFFSFLKIDDLEKEEKQRDSMKATLEDTPKQETLDEEDAPEEFEEEEEEFDDNDYNANYFDPEDDFGGDFDDGDDGPIY